MGKIVLMLRLVSSIVVSSVASFSRQGNSNNLRRFSSRLGLPFLQVAAPESILTRSMTATTTSSSTSASGGSSSDTMGVATPPVPPREEDRVVYVGAAPPGWKEGLPRQSESSKEKLIDPPVGMPDPYGWMRDEKRENKQVLDHLHAENAYTQVSTYYYLIIPRTCGRDCTISVPRSNVSSFVLLAQALTKHLDGLRSKLYDEMLASIQETDYTTPRPDGDYLYYTRTVAGQSYTIHCRAPKPEGKLEIKWDKTADSPIVPGEEVTLDVNHLAEGKSYCSTGTVTYSPSHKYLAYSADFSGGETCLLYVKDLTTGEIIDHDEKLEITGSVRWGADDSTLFYLKFDETHRPYQVYRRKLSSNEPDEMLLDEKDELYWMGIYKSLDGKYLFIETSSKETSEIHYLDLHDPDAKVQCISRRRSKVLYEVEHREGRWWIQSNVGGLPNMALFSSPAVPDSQENWEPVVGADGKALFEGSYERSLDYLKCFKNHIVASGREGGLPRIWFMSMGKDDVSNFEMLNFDEEAYDVGLGSNHEYDTDNVMVSYDSLVTPTQSLEINLSKPSERTVIKERAVPGYDKSLYACERTTVLSRDGKTEIPVSIVYRKDVMEKHRSSGKPAHVHLYGK